MYQMRYFASIYSEENYSQKLMQQTVKAVKAYNRKGTKYVIS